MKSLFQNIRTGIITKQECEADLNKLTLEKQELVKRLTRSGIGKELFEKERDKLLFMITLLQYLINVFDDLKLPLKVPKRELREEFTPDYYQFWD